MQTTVPSQTTPLPSPDAASYPPDPALVLPRSIYYQIVHTLGGLLPAPVTDTPEALAHRDNAAIAHVASLLPGNADEANLAARVAAADAPTPWTACALRTTAGSRPCCSSNAPPRRRA